MWALCQVAHHKPILEVRTTVAWAEPIIGPRCTRFSLSIWLVAKAEFLAMNGLSAWGRSTGQEERAEGRPKTIHKDRSCWVRWPVGSAITMGLEAFLGLPAQREAERTFVQMMSLRGSRDRSISLMS